MADNVVLNAGADGATLATASLTWSGDTAQIEVIAAGILSGSEGSWTFTEYVGGAGAVGAGVQRVTLANDDTLTAAANALLTTIDSDTGAMVTDLAAIEVLIAAGNVDLAALEVLSTLAAVDLAAMEVLLTAIDADTSKIPSQGQAAMAASTPVAIANDQSAIPVSGTFWQTTQPVSGTVAVTGTFWQATQPVSAVALPLPSGASTEATLSTLNGKVTACNTGAVVIASGSVTVDMGANNDVTMAVLPDTAAGDLAAMVVDLAAIEVVLGTIDVDTSALAGAVAGSEMQADIVKVGSVVDANNSTTTPLGGGAAYTGTGTDLTGYSAVCVTIYADVDSATDGMTFEFSTDNSNWDDVYTFTLDFSASSTRRFQFPVCAQYFRIVYTNGGGAQSAFRCQTILHTANQLTSIHRLADNMSPDRSAQVVKAALYAQAAGSGDLTLIDATAGGNLKVAVEEFDASLPSGTNNIGDVDVLTAPGTAAEAAALPGVFVVVAGDDGTDTHPLQVDGIGNLKIVSGTSGGNEVQGADAEDAAVTVNPVVTGGRYDTTERTLDNGDSGALAVSAEGWMMVGNQSSYLFDGTTRCQIKRVSGVAASGTTAIISAVSAKKFRILAFSAFATAATVTNIYLATTTDTDVLGNAGNPIPVSQTAAGDNVAGFVLPYNQGGWTETSTANEALNLILSAAYDVIYAITYIEVA